MIPPFGDYDSFWRETTADPSSNFCEGDFIATPPTGMKIDSMWDHALDLGIRSNFVHSFPTNHRRDVKLRNPPMRQSTLTSNVSTVKEETKQTVTAPIVEKTVPIPNKLPEIANQSDQHDQLDQVEKSDIGSNIEEDSVSEDREDDVSQKYLEDDQNSINSLNESASDLESVSETRKRKRNQDSSDELHRKKKRRKGRSQSHNKGSWTEEEHQLFLEGLEKYGRSKWREISQHVGTRTRIQVASHSQKYFAKSDQGKAARKMRTKRTSDD